MITVREVKVKHSGETRNAAVAMSGCLDSGETLTGTPTITDAANVLTLTNKAVSGATLTIDGVSVPAGEAVTFTVAGGTDGTLYTITITCGTSAGQTVRRKVKLRVTDN